MTMLETVENKQDLILLAEIGALIHDLGKLSAEFVGNKAQEDTAPPDKRWPEDIHAEIVQGHRFCPVPSDIAPYLTLSGDVNVEAVRQEAMARLQEALQRAFGEGELGRLLQEAASKRLGKTGSLGALSSQISLLYIQEKDGSIGGTLQKAIQRWYGRGSPRTREQIAELSKDWPAVETTREEVREWVQDLLTHEDRLRREEQVDLNPAEPFISETLRELLRTLAIPNDAEVIPLKDFIELHHRGHWQIPRLLHLLRAARPEREDEETQTAKGEPEGCDGIDSAVDKQLAKKEGEPQEFSQTMIATAFGYEGERIPVGPDEDGLWPLREELAATLVETLGKVQRGEAKPAKVRDEIFEAAEDAFRHVPPRPGRDSPGGQRCDPLGPLLLRGQPLQGGLG